MTEGMPAAVADRQVLSITSFYELVSEAIDTVFPASRTLWVRGEVQKCTESRGHAYIDLVDPDEQGARVPSVLNVKCWQRTWSPLKRELAESGLALTPGMTVMIRGQVDLYKARGALSLVLSELDVTALLGRVAKERQDLIDALALEGLLDAQRRLSLPLVPLRIGVVASPGTEGCNDFLGQLTRSGLGFQVSLVAATVQGERAPIEVARAIAQLDHAQVDLICVVRGGGSKADLAAFDAPPIAWAIARSTTPVWTGIGHTGDESVADLVAAERHITPTACGQAVVGRVASYLSMVSTSAARIASRATALCDERAATYARLRVQLAAEARSHLRTRQGELRSLRLMLAQGSRTAIERERSARTAQAAGLPRTALVHVERSQALNDARLALLSAYDPNRLLERGWSLTTTPEGSVVRSISQLAVGETIMTRFVDGEASSTVQTTVPREQGVNAT